MNFPKQSSVLVPWLALAASLGIAAAGGLITFGKLQTQGEQIEKKVDVREYDAFKQDLSVKLESMHGDIRWLTRKEGKTD